MKLVLQQRPVPWRVRRITVLQATLFNDVDVDLLRDGQHLLVVVHVNTSSGAPVALGDDALSTSGVSALAIADDDDPATQVVNASPITV